MENFFLQAIADDLADRLQGTSLGRVWQPSAMSLALDCRLSDGRFLFVSVDAADPAIFLTARSIVEVERKDAPDRAFASLLRKRLRGAIVSHVSKPPEDRIVRFGFRAFDASGAREDLTLIAELTGRSANVYLVDAASVVLGALRQRRDLDEGPQIYAPPPPDGRPFLTDLDAARIATLGPTPADAARSLAGVGPTLRAELDARATTMPLADALASLAEDLRRPIAGARLYATERFVLGTFELQSASGAACEIFADPSAAADARAERVLASSDLAHARRGLATRLRTALTSKRRVIDALESDLESTQGAERDREIAESLLAQVTSARVVDGGLEIIDLHSDDGRAIVVGADRGDTPQSVAERLFARHRKAKRTRERVAERSAILRTSMERLEELEGIVESATELEELDDLSQRLDALLGVRRVAAQPREARRLTSTGGTRRFVSSDGIEILVGRSSAANDALTFKVARPSDLWLHAADYPGSHVIARNPGRGEIPYRTILEAAQLAAFYSDARNESLADVRYTARRFVSKPRGAAPGLVRIARFKTIAVRPAADLDRAT